jgi:hypothetical protein
MARLLTSELGFVFPPLPEHSPNLAVLTDSLVDISSFLEERAGFVVATHQSCLRSQELFYG